MKNSIKVLVIFTLAILCYQANAQTFAIKGGASFANLLQKDNDKTYSEDYKLLPGFHFGVSVDLPFGEVISVEPGVLFNMKGFRFEEEEGGETFKGKYALNYIDIPVMLKASHELNGGLKLFGAVGPYVGMALSGKVEATYDDGTKEETEEYDLEIGNDEDDDDLKPLDFGLSVGAGAQINAFIIGLSYDYGLANLSPYQGEGTTFKNRVLRLSIGYRFGGN